jgi:hypothetical protein
MIPTLKKEKRTSTYRSTNIILVLINMLIRTLEFKLDRLHKSCSAISSFHLVPHFEECSPIISRAFSSSFFLFVCGKKLKIWMLRKIEIKFSIGKWSARPFGQAA